MERRGCDKLLFEVVKCYSCLLFKCLPDNIRSRGGEGAMSTGHGIRAFEIVWYTRKVRCSR